MSTGIKRVALGVCGGIAAYKAAEVLRGLQREGCQVRVCLTARAGEFVRPLTFRALSGEHVVVDDYAPDNPDPIAHITFSQSVDLLLVAPATANIIAKFAHGIADDFLSSTYLASAAPVLLAPAMNSRMWSHPATVRNVAALQADGVRFVAPDEGEMACGTIGPGRLAEPEIIVAAAMRLLRGADAATAATQSLAGERVVITAGATREALDPVRFISNRSSGKMGFALATAARARGAAAVTVVAGATTAAEPEAGIKMVRVVSAEEMRAAVRQEINGATIFIAAAAVADYRPANIATRKIKKTEQTLSLTLERTPDILGEVAQGKSDELIVVGFAAETHDLLLHAREKMRRKNLDLIVANDVSQDDSGFDTETNRVSILSRFQGDVGLELPLLSKLQVAERIFDEVVQVRRIKRGDLAIAR